MDYDEAPNGEDQPYIDAYEAQYDALSDLEPDDYDPED